MRAPVATRGDRGPHLGQCVPVVGHDCPREAHVAVRAQPQLPRLELGRGGDCARHQAVAAAERQERGEKRGQCALGQRAESGDEQPTQSAVVQRKAA